MVLSPHRVPVWAATALQALVQLPADDSANRLLVTFDDGPSDNSLRIADALDAAGVHAIFFLLGEESAARPQHVRDLAARGHTIGNHAAKHVHLRRYLPGRAKRIIHDGHAMVSDVLGERVRWFRPPYGSWWPWLGGALEQVGERCMYWTLDPRDYDRPPVNQLVDRATGMAADRDIVVMHCTGPGQDVTAAALPAILEGWATRGFTIVEPSSVDA